MKIKRKVEKNLPQLIEWAWDNRATENTYKSESITVTFSISGNPRIECEHTFLPKNETFTVEVEEEITEDTEFKSMVEVTTDDLFAVWEQASISTWESEHSKEFHAYIDGEFKLIWRDGKLVE